eukprot:UN16338
MSYKGRGIEEPRKSKKTGIRGRRGPWLLSTNVECTFIFVLSKNCFSYDLHPDMSSGVRFIVFQN